MSQCTHKATGSDAIRLTAKQSRKVARQPWDFYKKEFCYNSTLKIWKQSESRDAALFYHSIVINYFPPVALTSCHKSFEKTGSGPLWTKPAIDPL